ncbi:MAG: hypothetical protein D6715_08780 [Calditrichaeota bacterium]|nr:MAG: hypothetical protein D6715_08780 [Calditrichota bacterium]
MIGLVLLAALLVLPGCTDSITGEPHPNQPPDTRVFVQAPPGDSLNSTRSIQHLFWDGSDPDGFVVGFKYTWAANPTEADWVFTKERSGVFPLTILGQDTVYRFQVKAVDNLGAEDPTPATQLFPIVNSPPSISWTLISQIPDTTFTVAAFTWQASDPDGDSTIVAFEYALDDTSAGWRRIPGQLRRVILTADSGLTEGDHAFYIRAVDIAGSRSQTLRMPEDPNRFWHVRQPRGRYLLIDDYQVENSTTRFPDAFYRSMLNDILGPAGESFSYWNIETLFPANIDQFVQTVLLFDRVIWYSDIISESDDHFIAAQVAIPKFRDRGGKLIYTVQFNQGFGRQGDPLAFSPVDSLGKALNFIPPGGIYYPDSAFASAFPGVRPLPQLEVSGFILGIIALKPKVTSIPMYRYQETGTAADPIFVMIGRNDNTGQFDFVFAGTPLHFLQGNGKLNEFFDIVFKDIFGL